MNLFKIECFKLRKRKEFILIMCSLLCSVVLTVSFAIAPEAYSIEYSFGEIIPLSVYGVLGYAFFAALGVFPILFSILAISLSSSELDGHYHYLYFPRVADRTGIYRAKLLAMNTFAVIWYLLYTLVLNPISYHFLCMMRPDMASGAFADESLQYWVMMWIIMFVELLLYISVSLCMGLWLKPLTAILVVLAVFYGSMFFYNIPILKYFVPEYYKQMAMNSEDLNDPKRLIIYTVAFLLISAAYILITYLLGKRRIRSNQ